MKIHYIIITLVLFVCSCEEGRVTGVVVLDNKETVSASDLPLIVPPTLPLNDSMNSSASEPFAVTPKLLIRPRILIAKQPINDNANVTSSPPIAIVDSPQILTAKLPVDDSKNSSASERVVLKPIRLIRPPPLIVNKPVVDNVTGDLSKQPQILPIATSVKEIGLCAHAPCPMIYCKNNLPPIPSQGICCQRCVTNPKCNTTACPKYKCGTYLMPANLTAGECCDRCAPATVQPTKTSKRSEKPSYKPTKTTSKPKKYTDKHTKARSSSSSEEEEEEEEDNSRSSSSEQMNGKTSGCNIHRFNPKPNRSHSRLIRLLTEALAHFRHSHSRGRHDECSESQEN